MNIEDPSSLVDPATDDPSHLCLVLSKDASSGRTGPRTLKLMGSIHGNDALILDYSGSSHSFLSSKLANSLSGITTMSKPLKVTIADGELLLAQSELNLDEWSVQDCVFFNVLKVISLHHYEIILDTDWLESFSPLQVHWKQKWIIIPYQKQSAVLRGILPELPDETTIQLCVVHDDITEQLDFSTLPDDIQAILIHYKSVFDKPSQVPP